MSRQSRPFRRRDLGPVRDDAYQVIAFARSHPQSQIVQLMTWHMRSSGSTEPERRSDAEDL